MPKFAANLSMLFCELPFLDRFEAAAKAGFAAVEYLSPYEHAPEDIAARLKANGLKQLLFNLPAGDWAAGERGMAIYPDRKPEFRQSVALAVRYARALDCPLLHCLAGIAPADADHATLRKTYLENLRYAAGVAADAGITILIEPINTRDIPGYFLDHTATAADLIADVAVPNLRLQYDLYHMQIMEGDLAATISKYLPLIAHVQIADAPGRHEPGTGEIDFPSMFAHLDAIGYRGTVGCEYRPATTTDESLAWFRALRDARTG